MRKFKMMMLVVALCFVGAIQAQVRLGVKTALKATDVYFDNDEMKVDGIAGINAGLSLEAMVGKGGIGIESAVLYSQKGFDLHNVKVRNGYVEIPVNVKFKFGIPGVNPFVSAGPYVSFLVSGDENWQVRETESRIARTLETQKTNIGFNISTGIEVFGGLQVAAMLDFGTNYYYKSTTGNYKGYPRALAFSLTYYF